MNIQNCICRSKDLLIDRYQSFTCASCSQAFHLICYELTPFDKQNNLCFLCQVKSDPFLKIQRILITPFILTQKEFSERFQLKKEEEDGIRQGRLEIQVFCSRIKPSVPDAFPYEWPHQNIQVFLDNKLLPSYHLNYPIKIPSSHLLLSQSSHPPPPSSLRPSPPPPSYYPPSPTYLLVLKPPKDLNVRGAAMLAVVERIEGKEEKDKEIKRVAKDISIRRSLTEENIKKRFESLKGKDLEMMTSFPIKDPITQQLLYLPARGINCKHLSYFDLMNFLKYNREASDTHLRWKCPICRKTTLHTEIVVDLFLYKILKEIKESIENKPNLEDELRDISYICFDEKWNWKPKKHFSEEWEKKNKKSSNKPNPSHQNPSPEDVMIIETSSIPPSFSLPPPLNSPPPPLPPPSTLPPSLPPLYVDEISVDQCVNIYKDILSSMPTSPSSAPNSFISKKMKEYNAFKNFSAQKFYSFLLKASINTFLISSFPSPINILHNRSLEDFCKERSRKEIGELVEYALAWAQDASQIIEFLYILITRNSTQSMDMRLGLEILLIFAFVINKKKILFDSLLRHSLFSIYASLLKNLANSLDFQPIHYGKVFYFFSLCLPELNFPFWVEKSNKEEFYENLSDFVNIFLEGLDENDFKWVFFGSHAAPSKPLEELEEKRMARHFIYFFIRVFKKKESTITLDRISDYLGEWDEEGHLREFMKRENINLLNLSLEENELRNFSY